MQTDLEKHYITPDFIGRNAFFEVILCEECLRFWES
jgi:hypothetical protein